MAVVNLQGQQPRYSTFDLYGHDSTDLKAFLQQLQPGEVLLNIFSGFYRLKHAVFYLIHCWIHVIDLVTIHGLYLTFFK